MKTYYQTFLVLFLFVSCSKDIEPEVIPNYSLKVSATPVEGGTVTPLEGSYPQGTTVSLLATPSPEYIFKEWNGGVTGTTNPISVTMNLNKNISVVFEKRKYPLSITIVGEGTVTEELLSSKPTGDYPSGSVVKLTAVPVDGWKFVEWSGDIESNENPFQISINKQKSISVKFEIDCDLLKYPLVDLKLSSYFTGILYHPKDILTILSNYSDNGTPYVYGNMKISVDYNRDGFLDFISFQNSNGSLGWETSTYIMFFKGNCSGNMVLDEVNSNKFLGLLAGRKIIYGDYNNDEYPDILFIGHGKDEPPYPGESPLLLLSDGDGGFIENRLVDYIGYFHSGCSGDFDNDGDLDIILMNPGNTNYILNNLGDGSFSKNTDFVPKEKTFATFTSELIDIDKDGFLDLVTSGHDWVEPNFNNPSTIFYGNGYDFKSRFKTLPSSFGYGVCIDVDFYDINSDGKYEIIMNRTGDTPNGLGFYIGWKIQILEEVDGNYIDSTEKYIENYFSESENPNEWYDVSDYDNDGIVELRNSKNPDISYEIYHEWELLDGKFIRKN